MTVIDILSIVSDETNVNVWENGEIIATYDGKDNIPEELNDRVITQISAGIHFINIDI